MPNRLHSERRRPLKARSQILVIGVSAQGFQIQATVGCRPLAKASSILYLAFLDRSLSSIQSGLQSAKHQVKAGRSVARDEWCVSLPTSSRRLGRERLGTDQAPHRSDESHEDMVIRARIEPEIGSPPAGRGLHPATCENQGCNPPVLNVLPASCCVCDGKTKALGRHYFALWAFRNSRQALSWPGVNTALISDLACFRTSFIRRSFSSALRAAFIWMCRLSAFALIKS